MCARNRIEKRTKDERVGGMFAEDYIKIHRRKRRVCGPGR